jgi:hypothetical protein
VTRLGRACALIAVFAGGYAILMLINGQLTDFDVSAGVGAATLLGATLFESVVRLSRKTLAHGRAAVWEHSRPRSGAGEGSRGTSKVLI